MNQIINPGVKIGLCSLVLAVSACQQNNSEPVADETGKTTELQEPVQDAPTLTSVNPAADWTRQVNEAIADLSTRTGVTSEGILVRSARAVTWGSTAVGCPQPDTNYDSEPIDGLQVVLETDGAIYFYHGKDGASLFYCPKELAKAPAYGPGEVIM